MPKQDVPVTSIGISVDGTCVKLAEGSWREATCGSISLYDKDGERLHTAYFAASPERGKARFHAKMDREINRVLERFPKARVTGLGDGVADNWTFLGQYTENLVPDFWHASEYVHKTSDAYWTKSEAWSEEKAAWEDHWFHVLKHEPGGAAKLLKELRKRKKEVKGKKVETMQKTITYIANHLDLMNYAREVERGAPIGSGIIESACRRIVKDRMSIAGAGWSLIGVEVVLTLRSLCKSGGHWGVFWSRVMRYGIPGARFFGPFENDAATKHEEA